ncbi:acyl-CoA dehydrogenase [Mycolicibacterium aubagnense]|uniref:Acyl-CoA dehydrogenase FadE n=1 Tax=Mycolicibacterium aubagnense TaxID=319707 RepID=A0ABM7IKP7_9MYCO|nr:acyl-CoA dehydrogenase [Mycolicibacterium aubagnense]TLH65615.1 acyl-CoA dehydrogenase [Mycolicibacterium aubagnense]WGI31226.1 acyl-CoA dehydrogenase [Mycolicibacterium aubagnense]BBX87376.1 putative acyl-CoA dehydrogenase FadE [Mycolicibacterium aubagnense]
MATNNGLGIAISDEHLALADAVHRLVTREVPREVLRTAVDEPGAMPAFWSALAEQGLLGLHLDEAYGGQGAGLVGAAVALEAIGRSAAPGPYVSSVMASAVIAASSGEVKGKFLPGLADGTVVGGVGLEPGLCGIDDGSGSLIVHGSTAPVLGALLADVVVLGVYVAGARRWVVVDRAELTVRPDDALDVVHPLGIVVADGVCVPADRVLAGVDDDVVGAVSAVILGAEAVGVTSWCVSTAAEYATVREQFGRPIGQFQGVKHRCAQGGIALEQARAAVWDAARALDEGDDTAGYAAAVAAMIAPDAAVRGARDAIQILGGIGYTWEHDAHLYYRRALVLRGLLGRSRDCAVRVARLALQGQRREVALDLPSESERLRAEIRAELAQISELDDEAQRERLGDGGWVMPFLPRPAGRAAGPVEQVIIGEEIKRAGIVPPELGLAAWLIPAVALSGTAEQYERLVAPTLRGDIFWCQLFSEPGAGSDLASLRTEAVKVDGGWRVNGQKIWTSLGFLAEWGALLARTDPQAPKHAGITYFVVEMDSPGITIRQLKEMNGGSMFCEVFFDNVFIPDSGVVGAVNAGWSVARDTLSYERVALGKGNPIYPAVDDLLEFVRAREADPPPLARVGELVAENQTLQLLMGRAVLKQLSGVDAGVTSAVAKFLNMRFGQQVADFCHAELGASGLVDPGAGPAGIWIDHTLTTRAMTIYGGTTEVQLNVIGERMLGLPRDAAV